MEYTIGWPLDERTVAGIERLREGEWGVAVHTDGNVDPAAQVAALATSLTAWLRHLALEGDLAKASTKTLWFRILFAPARLVTHARRRILKIPPGWQ